MSRYSPLQDTAAATSEGVSSPWLVEEFVESYVCWRKAAAAAKAAYEQWTLADPKDCALAFEGYSLALESEERAARGYRDCAEWVAGRGTRAERP